MTAKGKRAGALRKVDRDDAQGGWISGGMVDESFPVEAVHHALVGAGVTVDLDAFGEFYGRRLGRFRDFESSRTSTPSVGDELALIAELLEAIEQTRTRLENLPPMTDAYLNQVCWLRQNVLFHEVARGIDTQLKEVTTMLWLTEREMEPYQGQRGRNTSSNRDHLLLDVAEKLTDMAGLGKEAAAGCAAGVLRASRVPAPDDPKEAAKIIRNIAKRIREGEITLS